MVSRINRYSFRIRIYIILCLILIHLLFSLHPSTNIVSNGKLKNIQNYQELESNSAFSFSIISDNHGQSVYENINMAKTNYHIQKSNDVCVLGLGDHLTSTGTNNFLFYVCNDPFWKENFYPTISDNENAFYGKSQADWGAGKYFFDAIDFDKRKNIEFSKEGVDYYAIIEAPHNYRIHWISLHFPDESQDRNKIAFKESSKNFLKKQLLKITKSKHDIVIVGAHGLYGYWLNELNPELFKLIIEKSDLILGANTHYYERFTPDGFENKGPLILSTGSVTYPRFKSKPGFIQVRLMENHEGMYVSYIDVTKETKVLNSSPFSFFRSFNGKIYELNYNLEL